MNLAEARVEQALVTVGGQGSRLRARGIAVPLSKSFLELEGHTLLFWCLYTLQLAGVRRVVLIAETDEKLDRARRVVATLPCAFSEVAHYRDDGLGTTGLPFHARHLLDPRFFFQCGHAIVPPQHYRLLQAEASADQVVFTGFRRFGDSARQCFASRRGPLAIAEPALLTAEYAEALPAFDFHRDRVLRYLLRFPKVRFAESGFAIEFDVAAELTQAFADYRRLVRTLPAAL